MSDRNEKTARKSAGKTLSQNEHRKPEGRRGARERTSHNHTTAANHNHNNINDLDVGCVVRVRVARLSCTRAPRCCVRVRGVPGCIKPNQTKPHTTRTHDTRWSLALVSLLSLWSRRVVCLFVSCLSCLPASQPSHEYGSATSSGSHQGRRAFQAHR